MDLDEIKKLRPGERIKHLKELERKRKKEIEQAGDMIRSSENELRIEEELKDIPIPQVKAVDIEHLFGADERKVFRAKRFLPEETPEIAPEAAQERAQEKEEEASLEETVSREATETQEGAEAGPIYGSSAERVQENLKQLYSVTEEKMYEEMVNMRDRAAGGIWSEQDEQELQYRMSQMENASNSQQYAGAEAQQRFERTETIMDQIRMYRSRMGM